MYQTRVLYKTLLLLSLLLLLTWLLVLEPQASFSVPGVTRGAGAETGDCSTSVIESSVLSSTVGVSQASAVSSSDAQSVELSSNKVIPTKTAQVTHGMTFY